jgi:hypothetical protein
MNKLDDLTMPHPLSEVARILAAGVLRLHSRAALAVDSPGQSGSVNLPENPEDCLEVPAETMLSVHNG